MAPSETGTEKRHSLEKEAQYAATENIPKEQNVWNKRGNILWQPFRSGITSIQPAWR